MFRVALKKIYKIIPMKGFLFSLLKSFYIPSRSIYQHLTFEGVVDLNLDDNKFKIYNPGTLIANQLFWNGINGFEPNSLRIWIKLCKNSNTILDIGANTGVYSLLAKSVNNLSTVHAFEPVERVYKLLERNSLINNFDIISHNKAVSNYDGVGMFYDDDEKHTTSVVINRDRSSEKGLHKVETQVVKLDTFITINNIKNIDLIKMDVELHEPEAIEGFTENLEKMRPTIIIEVIRDYVSSALQEHFSGLDYNYFYINEPFGGGDYNHDTHANGYIRVESLINCKLGNYLICQDNIVKDMNLV